MKFDVRLVKAIKCLARFRIYSVSHAVDVPSNETFQVPMLRTQLARVTQKILSGLYAVRVENRLRTRCDEEEGDGALQAFRRVLCASKDLL